MAIQNAPSGTIRSALRYPAFRSLLTALAVSQVGDWLYNLTLVVRSGTGPIPRCGPGLPQRPASCLWCCSARSVGCSPTGSTAAAP
jgi:hypothetical protein